MGSFSVCGSSSAFYASRKMRSAATTISAPSRTAASIPLCVAERVIFVGRV